MRLASAQQEQLLRLVKSPDEPVRAAALEVAGSIDLAETALLKQVIEPCRNPARMTSRTAVV
jgi:hypothetical protein